MPPLEQQFQQLAAEWRRDTAMMSSIRDICTHPSYQEIIGMGSKAVPFIIRELKEKAEHWFWALKQITGVNPVPPADRGDIPKMRDHWLKWYGDAT